MKKRDKSREQKRDDYEIKYGEIPLDPIKRFEYMYDKFNVNDKRCEDIITTKINMLHSLYYKEFNVVLLEEPEGAKRPRFRLINRKNLAQAAMANGNFVHVYSPNAKEDSVYMERLIGNDLIRLDEFIYTPCIVEYNIYCKTPSAFNVSDVFLAEMGIIRPITKPDWDNIGKKYSDMYNSNIWIDDTLVISGTVNKYYSILPRVEIKLKYLNMLYNKYQYSSMNKKIESEAEYYMRGK